ncbi:MmgE/PrpD family protein [Acidisphaera sp. S103]|uniref:MmgE/PrpD family protein n=1 Tax=Acidisphaera sp. S103 TaxID=1747223 RepID=UPI00131DB933|nr:MmgE/PrpD family protein [Acidisphaera sp. S103]
MTVARDLADFLVGTSTEDLPPQAMRHAAMIIASTIASAAYGTQIQSARIIRDLTREQGGRPDASLWFDAGARLPVAEVARANAMLSDAAASDDSDLRNIVHAGTPLTATALAFAERIGATGQDVLTAIVLGYEAAGRISEAITPGFRARGFHGCLGAVFAAAVAASRLLRLSAEQTAQSIAIAATSIGGLATAADTSVAREYHAGLAAQLGVNAALAAQRGYLAEERILETFQGFFEAFGGVDGATAAGVATRDLGQSWDIVTDMAIKLVPGGHPYHAFGEAGANAARDGNIAASDVDTITICRPGFTKLSGPLHPTDLIGMAHSPAYFVAAGVADHAFSWVHASDAKIADPVIHGLIDKVRVGAQPTEDAARYRQGATVTIRTRDGRTSTSTVFLPKGAGALGIAWDDIDAKYRTLVPAAGLPADKIEASLALIHDFHRVTDVSSLTGLLR